jgi:hypothetical protein
MDRSNNLRTLTLTCRNSTPNPNPTSTARSTLENVVSEKTSVQVIDRGEIGEPIRFRGRFDHSTEAFSTIRCCRGHGAVPETLRALSVRRQPFSSTVLEGEEDRNNEVNGKKLCTFEPIAFAVSAD